MLRSSGFNMFARRRRITSIIFFLSYFLIFYLNNRISSQSNTPTGQPTNQPTNQPTRQPASQPSRQPTRQPTGQPSRQPSSQPSGQPTTQPTIILPAFSLHDGLIAYYNCNNQLKDFSGNGNHGTNHGASFPADRFGNAHGACGFDGNAQYFEVLNGNSFNFDTYFSVVFCG